MPALPAYNPTFIDLAKAFGPDGTVLPVAEVLNLYHEGLDPMVWKEANLLTGHQFNVRTGLPTATWGKLYKGVQPSKGTVANQTVHTAFLESLSEVDERLCLLAPNPIAFRETEDRPHIEAMGQAFFTTLFKGKSQNAEQFIGLEEYFNDATAPNGVNIIDTGIDNDTDIVSIWLIGWGDTTVYGVYPKGMQVGLEEQDWGLQVTEDDNGGKYRVYNTYWRWGCGLAVQDWRYVVRAQVDVSELDPNGVTGIKLASTMRDMLERLPAGAGNGQRLAFYMNRTVRSIFAKQAESKLINSTLTYENIGAVGPNLSPRRTMFFDGVPIYRVDQLTIGETYIPV